MQKAAEREEVRGALTVALHVAPVLVGQVADGWQIAQEDKRTALAVLDAAIQRADADTAVATPAAARQLTRRFTLDAPAADRPQRLLGIEPTGLGLGGRALSRFVGRSREL